MPKLKIAAATPTRDVKVVALVKGITGLAISSALSRLAAGKHGWLLTADLFKGDHEDRASEVERLIAGLRGLGIEPYILYAPTSTSWELVVQHPERYETSAEAVLRILHETDAEFD